MKLEVTKERVLQAAENCPQAKNALRTLFPEAFIETPAINLQKGDILVSKTQNKSYLITIDGDKFVRIVGLHSAYAWEKRVKPVDRFSITASDISAIFPGRKLSDYVLRRNGKFYDIIIGTPISNIDNIGKYNELYQRSIKLF